jgi:hypothetical protein
MDYTGDKPIWHMSKNEITEEKWSKQTINRLFETADRAKEN